MNLEVTGGAVKSLEHNFIDWEGSAFGYGYGTGEVYILPELKKFFAAFGWDDRPQSYNHEQLEAAVGPVTAWLLINVLCHADAIEYGTSPRYGWLTKKGEALKAFVDGKTSDELLDLVGSVGENYCHCYPDACNCGPNGYEEGRKCGNPFWV